MAHRRRRVCVCPLSSVRLFFDTNVLVSAFLARGLCTDLLRLVLMDHTLVTSEVVLAEWHDVLVRKGR